MIVLIGGALGTGKTLKMTILGYMAYQLGFKVYSNYKTTFSEMINPLNLLDFNLENCIILLDEAYLLFDSRVSGHKSNRLFSYFFLQSRKRTVDVVCTSQIIGAIDLRLRAIADYYILAEKRSYGFKYTYYQKEFPYCIRTLSEDEAKPFYPMYDTSEIIIPFIGSNVDLKEVEQIYDESPTRKVFITMLRADFPNLTLETSQSVYDLLKADMRDKARKLLDSV